MKGPVLAMGFLCLLASPVGAVLERAGEHVHDIGQVRLFATNLGIVGNPWYPSFSDLPSLEWPAGSGHEFLQEAGLWVAARDRVGNVAAVSTAGPVNEFRPSLVPEAHTRVSFDGAPGTRRLGTTDEQAEADDDLDGAIDEEFLNGADDDGDGRVDEDYPAIGSQMLTCEYRDDTPEARAQLIAHRPMGLAVRQTSFTWAEGTSGLDRCVVLRYQVTNAGPAPLFDLFLGFYVDPDVGPKATDGYWRDDRYTVETVRGTFPNRGAPIRRGCGSVPYERVVATVEDVPDLEGGGGGDAPGILGAVVLDHTTHFWGFRAPEVVGLHGVVHLAGRPSVDRTREDLSDSEKFALLARGGVMGDTRTDDHRFVMVVGPFSELAVGATLELTVALVVAPDRPALGTTVTRLVEEFHGQWINLDGNGSTPPPPSRDRPNGYETCLTAQEARYCSFSPFRVDHDCDERETQERLHAGCRNIVIQTGCPTPSDPDNDCSLRLLVASSVCTFVDGDCDSCTPNVLGAESLVRWANTSIRVSSRPIVKRISPGDRRVLVEWDNAAELPTAARELPPVAGYRVWRSSGWTRPPGSGGPGAESWELIAELPLPESGLPPAPEPFIVEGVSVIDTVPGPGDSLVPHYDVGRYRLEDREVANGFALFYDVTPFSLEIQGGVTVVESLVPRAQRGEHVFPAEAPSEPAAIRVVPNPYVSHASWDLSPDRTDPSGRKILFMGLPPRSARIRIFTLAGDLVREIDHGGSTGSAAWDLLSRNGQPVAPGIYLYAIESAGQFDRGKLVIVQ